MEDVADRQRKGFLMTTRRQFLIGISAALVSSPAIVRAESLMQVRGIVMPLHQNYYGWCDRLAINLHYHSGELRGSALIRLIDEGLLKHVPPAILAYDLARWGTAQLSSTAREERRRILWPPVKRRAASGICLQKGVTAPIAQRNLFSSLAQSASIRAGHFITFHKRLVRKPCNRPLATRLAEHFILCRNRKSEGVQGQITRPSMHTTAICLPRCSTCRGLRPASRQRAIHSRLCLCIGASDHRPSSVDVRFFPTRCCASFVWSRIS